MRFSVKGTPQLMPCIVRDVEGLEIQDVVSGDTTTGICWVYLRGSTGKFIKGRFGIVQAEKKFKAPLTIECLTQSSQEFYRYLESLNKRGNLAWEEQGKSIIIP